MPRNTNTVQKNQPTPVPLDEIDRKILRLLAEDATQTYTELGKRVHLTAPAVHERVKRLKRNGVIIATVAKLNGKLVGCPLLAFIHVETVGSMMIGALDDLIALADVEEVHTVTGDTCVVLKVRTRDTKDLEGLLDRIYQIEGVRSTKSYVVLDSYLERGPKPEVVV